MYVDEKVGSPAGMPEAGESADRGCQECPVKSVTALIRDLDSAVRGLVPDEFWQHRRAARKEALLALRSLLDAAIEHVEEEPAQRGPRGASKIPIA